MKVNDIYSGIVEVKMSKAQYRNGNTALQLWCSDGPYATLSVNLCNLDDPHLVYLDTNNCPWAEEFVKENNLGHPMAMHMRSGWCTYPLYWID